MNTYCEITCVYCYVVQFLVLILEIPVIIKKNLIGFVIEFLYGSPDNKLYNTMHVTSYIYSSDVKLCVFMCRYVQMLTMMQEFTVKEVDWRIIECDSIWIVEPYHLCVLFIAHHVLP